MFCYAVAPVYLCSVRFNDVSDICLCENGCVRVDVLIFAMMMGVVDTVVIYFFIDTVVL